MSSTNDNNVEGEGSKRKISMVFNEDDQAFDVYVKEPGSTRPGLGLKVPRTEEELDRFFPYTPPKLKAPEPYPQETLDLYNKAIDVPHTLTDEERLRILEWVSEDTANERCRAACGIDWQELLTVAVERPQDLTYDDICFINSGRSLTYKDGTAAIENMSRDSRQPDHIQKLRWDALDMAKGSRYATAESNARSHDQARMNQEREEAVSQLSNDDEWNIKNSAHIPWIPRMTAASPSHWGLVCFRTAYNDNEAWEAYRKHVLHCSRTGLLLLSGTNFLSKRWKVEFIDNDKDALDGASLGDLCTYFKTPPSSSPLTASMSSGLRNDVFLYADARTISSLNDPADDPSLKGHYPAEGEPPFSTDHLIRGYIIAADVSYDPEKAYKNEFKGVLKVHPAHLATTFYQRLKARGQEQEEGSERWWNMKQDWETMFKVARSRGKREGEIYPPSTVYNRSI